jgi:hypothetical protein
MDQRQAQIREGAGLTESRLNQDFIDFLQKWGWPALMLAAVAFMGYRGWQWYGKQQIAKVDQAFAELAAVGSNLNANPDALQRVADEYGTVRGIGDMARIQAADAYLRAIRAGTKTGAELNPDGTLAKPEDALNDEFRNSYLSQAETLYRKVADDSYGKPEKAIFRINALFGLAAVAECRGEVDKARTMYEEIVAATDQTAFEGHAKIAKKRMESLPKIASPVALLSTSDFPKIPGIDVPLPQPVPGPEVTPPTSLDLSLPGFTGPTAPEAPKTDVPPPIPGEAPKTDAPKSEPEKTEPPKTDPKAPPAEAPKTPEVPKQDAPK